MNLLIIIVNLSIPGNRSSPSASAASRTSWAGRGPRRARCRRRSRSWPPGAMTRSSGRWSPICRPVGGAAGARISAIEGFIGEMALFAGFS